MPEIALSDVAFAFAKEDVLTGIDFEVNRGDFVTLLGGSGCGKSTLLRLVAGLLQPSSGSIEFDPTNLTQQHLTQRQQSSDVGFVFQKPTLCPWLTVEQNVALPLALKGVSPNERKQICDEAIKLVGLRRTSDASKYPHQLSGGMQMRVSLARAFVTKPRLMLMDEPFSALDEVLRQQLAETCLDLWKRESWTTVFVTHNVAEAVFLSQRIYILARRPATIVDSIEVSFPDRGRELRTSDEFTRMVANVSQRLRNAVEGN